MDDLLILLISLVLVIITIQDLKNRLISIFALLFLVILSVFYWYVNSKEIITILYSVSFLFLNFTSLKVYTIITKKKKTEDLIYGLGLGDILFFIAIIPLFNTTNYILFFISGLVVSIIIHSIVSLFMKNELIPLAGYLSLYLIVFLTCIKFFDKSNYIDLIHLR